MVMVMAMVMMMIGCRLMGRSFGSRIVVVRHQVMRQ